MKKLRSIKEAIAASEIKITVEIVTPKLATEFLTRNTANRPIDGNRVVRYVREMQLGRWQLNGDTIRIASDNQLLDGQHRLLAIVQSNIDIPQIVIRGLDPAVFPTIDTGKIRTVRDMLATQGHFYTAELATAARVVYILNGIFTDKSNEAAYTAFKWKGIVPEDVLDVVRKTPILQDRVGEFVCQYKKVRKIVSKGGGAALFHLFALKNLSQAQDFMEKLDSGIGIGKDNVIYQAREKLLELQMKSQHTDLGYKLAIVVKAWNLIRDGYHDKKLTVSSGYTMERIK